MDTNISTRRIKPKNKPSHISMDSLKLRISIENVKGITPDITAKRLVVNELTGNVERELKAKGSKVYSEGISTYYGIETQPTGHGTATKDFFVILFNSKLLKANYLDGITINNIDIVYKELMKILPIQFSYKAFLKGECTDVDFKKDIISSNFQNSLKTFASHAKPNARRDYGYKLRNEANNKGIEFTDRKKATPSNPFLKFYAKSLELKNNSNDFKQSHLDSSNVQVNDNLVRVEFTLKNKKHFRKHNIDDTSLRALLKLKQKKKRKILKKIVAIHLEPRVRKEYNFDNIAPTDAALVKSINMLMKYGLSYENIKANYLNEIVKRSSKHNFKKRLDNLYMTLIDGNKNDKVTRKQDKFFNSIGWS